MKTPRDSSDSTLPAHSNPEPIDRRAFAKKVIAAAGVGQLANGALRADDDRRFDDRRTDSGRRNKLEKRRNDAFRIRVEAAEGQRQRPIAVPVTNGDETLYANRIGSFSKGLPHNQLGEVDPAAFQALLRAVDSGDPSAFEAIPLGCPIPAQRRKLTNPQAGLGFDLEGADSHALTQPPAPAFASAETAGEILENYWMALCRDVSFSDYASNGIAQAAAGDLSSLSDFRGPKISARVTPATLFRGITAGDLNGPHVSQFLYLQAPFGATFIEQRMRTYTPGVDFMTSYGEWLNIQRGCIPAQTEVFDSTARYIRNGRDLSQWVHMDVLYQAYFHAMVILLTPPSSSSYGGMGAPTDAGNPYRSSANQDGFGTFGAPHLAGLMTEVAGRALKAVWYQKWFVHRRLRPEAYAGRVHNFLTGAATYPLGSNDLLGSPVFNILQSKYGSFLLPMAFPEGSPLHPSYGAGHATVAGACVTILKAWFDESYVIPNPVQPSADGLSLLPYIESNLTVGGELNKLASNIAFGRNHAGVHWRSDAIQSLKLGEEIALNILRDQRGTYNERFRGFSLTRFDGRQVNI